MYFVLGSAAVAGFKSDKSHGDYKLGETNSGIISKKKFILVVKNIIYVWMFCPSVNQLHGNEKICSIYYVDKDFFQEISVGGATYFTEKW